MRHSPGLLRARAQLPLLNEKDRERKKSAMESVNETSGPRSPACLPACQPERTDGGEGEVMGLGGGAREGVRNGRSGEC